MDVEFVNHAVRECFFGGHPMIAVGILTNLLYGSSRMVGDDLIEFLFEFEYLFGGYLNIGCLALDATSGLMDHHAAVGQRSAHALLTGYQQYGAHRGSQTGTDRGDAGLDKLHRIIDTESGIYRTTRRI